MGSSKIHAMVPGVAGMLPQMQYPADMQEILHMYGLKFLRLESCPSAYSPGAAYRAITTSGSVFVKPYRGTEARLRMISRKLKVLNRSGFTQMPKWHATLSGKRWVTRRGKLFYLTEWIDGRQLGDDGRQMRALGETIARLHARSRSLVSRVKAVKLSTMEVRDLQRQSRTFRRDLAKLKQGDSEDSRWFREEGQTCLRLADKAWGVIRRPGMQRVLQANCSFVHGDLTRPNVLIHGESIRLLDWEQVKEGISLFELSKVICNTTDFRVRTIDSLLTGYESVRRLTDQERLLVYAMMCFPREAWYCARGLLSGNIPAGYDVLRNMWGQRLQAVSWLETWSHRT